MSLNNALLEMKEELQRNQIDERKIIELEQKHGLKSGTLVYYYHQLSMLNLIHEKSQKLSDPNTKKVNRKWTKSEIQLLFQYIREREEEGALNITDILEEAANLLGRGYQSVNYKYYTMMKEMNKKEQDFSVSSYQFTTINESEVPVIATEPILDLTIQRQDQVKVAEHSREDDLLDILSGLITNAQKLPTLNLTDLLRSIHELTNLALINQNKLKQFEESKSNFQYEKEMLHEQLKKQEQQLLRERKRNNELQQEMTNLVEEIMAFNKLGDSGKIQNLKAYNQRLNLIINNFGEAL